MTEPASSEVVPKKTGSQAAVHIAATLCYLAGIFYVISAIVMVAPKIQAAGSGRGSAPAFLIITGVLYIVAGFLLRREQRRGGVLAVGMIVGRLALQVAAGGPYLNMWVIIDVGILVLIALNWRQLRDPGPTVV